MAFNATDKRIGERITYRADRETREALDVLSDRIVDALKKEPPWIGRLPNEIVGVVRTSLLTDAPPWAVAIEDRIGRSEYTIQKDLQQKADAAMVGQVQEMLANVLRLEHEASKWQARVDIQQKADAGMVGKVQTTLTDVLRLEHEATKWQTRVDIQQKADAGMLGKVQVTLADVLRLEHEASEWQTRADHGLTSIEDRIGRSEATIQKNLQQKADAGMLGKVQVTLADVLRLERKASEWQALTDKELETIAAALQRCNHCLQSQARELLVLRSWVEWRARPWYRRWFRKWLPPTEIEGVANGKQV